MDLEDFGWNSFFAEHFPPHAQSGLCAGRVIIEHRGGYRVAATCGELHAELSGKLRHEVRESGDLPVVGDWVAVALVPQEERAIIKAILPRRTAFSRKAAGRTTDEQILASNIDLVFIVSSLEGDFNPRRLERYLTLAWESGAEPVVVLNKADLCRDVDAKKALTESVAIGVPIHTVSALTGRGMETLKPCLICRKTAAFLGSSGVGKSTLINALSGEELLDVQEVREKDQKGRHTTTHRQLLRLPGGGLVIDTPGIRELHLWEGEVGVDSAFPEIEELSLQCRFSDCNHQTEPGCAVRGAVEKGMIATSRLESYRKLHRELRRLDLQQNDRVKAEDRKKISAIHRSLRSLYKKRDKHRK